LNLHLTFYKYLCNFKKYLCGSFIDRTRNIVNIRILVIHISYSIILYCIPSFGIRTTTTSGIFRTFLWRFCSNPQWGTGNAVNPGGSEVWITGFVANRDEVQEMWWIQEAQKFESQRILDNSARRFRWVFENIAHSWKRFRNSQSRGQMAEINDTYVWGRWCIWVEESCIALFWFEGAYRARKYSGLYGGHGKQSSHMVSVVNK
jgi:hypothetical protein